MSPVFKTARLSKKWGPRGVIEPVRVGKMPNNDVFHITFSLFMFDSYIKIQINTA